LRTIESNCSIPSPDLAELIQGLSRRLGACLSSGTAPASHDPLGARSSSKQRPSVPDAATAGTAYSDPRRGAPRLKWSHPVQYSFDQSTWSSGYFRDLSQYGTFILTHEPTPVGSLVFIKFDLPRADRMVRIEIIGHVVRQGNGKEALDGIVGMGVMFVSIPEDHERYLKDFLSRQLIEQGRRTGRIGEIRFHCDDCQRILTAPQSMSGVSVHCACGCLVTVPYAQHHPLENNPMHGFQIAGCRIDTVIGKGGSATVYKAHHLTLDIPVAVKILDRGHSRDSSESVERFIREARVIARIRHPNIVMVMNAGEEHGHRFLVMQYVPCQSLGDILSNAGPLSLNDFVWIFLHICRALSAAHRGSIIHGDVKPDNILISRGGTAMLVDFGLVRLLSDPRDSAQSELIMGSPLYMAPEQVTGKGSIDLRADIYSLGATMFHALVGRPAFTGLKAVEVMLKHVHESLVPPAEISTRIPKVLSDIVVKAMAKQPSGRYQSVDQIHQALTRFSKDLTAQEFKPLSRLLRQGTKSR
ncbi:MAG: serine/threonine protein kinase, partial [Desulfomonile sp.]|nr:serine/threonine protein kinase [Desulfomonile sp.]